MPPPQRLDRRARAPGRHNDVSEPVDQADRTAAINRQADALMESARARSEQAKASDRLAEAVEGFLPAAQTIHGFAARLDIVCKWLKSGWPWLFAMVFLVLVRTIFAAPQDLPKLLDALAAIIGLMFK